LETKYRDIADGNDILGRHHHHLHCKLETKYRDIADGNDSIINEGLFKLKLETKYRDIADGNPIRPDLKCTV